MAKAAIKAQGPHYVAQGTATVGDPVVVEIPKPTPATITVVPGGGGTVDVEITPSPLSAVNANTALWTPWPKGQVAEADSDSFLGSLTAVRITAGTTNATYAVCV